MAKGWAKIYRDIAEHWIWEDKPFSRGQAWIDLLLLANHADGKALRNGDLVEVKRGEHITSILKLSERWGWGRKKTSNFLDLLEKDEMLTQKRTTKDTTIFINKYSDYQGCGDNEDSEEQQKEQQRNNGGTTDEQQRNTNKNVKNVKNDKEDIYAKIRDLYNNTCVSFPRCTKLSDSRKKAIKARLNTYSLEGFEKLFELAEQSDFLKGSNNRDWSANFDWLLKDKNMVKVLDGNYVNKARTTVTKQQSSNKFNNFQGRERDYGSLEEQLLRS